MQLHVYKQVLPSCLKLQLNEIFKQQFTTAEFEISMQFIKMKLLLSTTYKSRIHGLIIQSAFGFW